MQVTDCAFSTSIHGLSAKNKGHELKWKKLGAVTYITDQENEVSKTLIIFLASRIGLENTL